MKPAVRVENGYYLGGVGTNNEMISDEFDPEIPYSKGRLCINNNILYKFTDDKAAGEWDDTVVEKTNIANELGQINSDLSEKVICVTKDATISSISSGATVGVGLGSLSEWTDQGYSFIGCTVSSNKDYIVASCKYTTSNTLNLHVYNGHTAAQSNVTCTGYILFMK